MSIHTLCLHVVCDGVKRGFGSDVAFVITVAFVPSLSLRHLLEVMTSLFLPLHVSFRGWVRQQMSFV